MNVAVFRIQIRGIRMFLGLVDPNPNPLFICMDPDPDPSINKQKNEENLDFYLITFYLWRMM
jgi:hypothetical protein